MINKRSFKKSIISLGLTAMLSTTLLAQSVYATPWVHEERTTEPIASGVTHEQILRFGETGWQRVNVVRVNLKDENNRVNVLNSMKGVTERETLTEMLKQQENAVAAINADFFHNTKPDSPLGLMIREGKMVSSPVTEKPYSSLAVTNDGTAFLGDWLNHMYVSTENGNIFSIMAYNKITWNYHRITMLDSNWGEMTPGAAGEYQDIVEIIVEDDRVSEIRHGRSPARIPSNGYVILASGQQGQSLLQGIKPGEKISFYSQTSPNLEQIQLAVGGGTVLVRDGRIATFTEPVTGNHPRTAVGINRTGDQLIMVTVDGRHRSFTGVNGQSMASIMIELGSEQAILMDGGGSTTMATRPLGDTDIRLTNTPSDGTQRRIINSLAVSSTAPRGSLSGMMFESAQINTFVGHPVSLALKGYDTFYQPYSVDDASVRYQIIEGQGRIENQKLIPDAAGRLTVEASYQGKTVQKMFQVLSNVSALHIEMSRYTMNPGAEIELRIEGIDPKGFRAPLSMDRIQMSDDHNLGAFQNGSFKAGQKEGTTILRAAYNGHKAAVPIAIGLKRVPVGPLDQFRPVFLGYPASVGGQVQMTSGGSANQNAVRLDYDFTGSAGTTAAYVVFGDKGIPLTQQPARIAMRVHAESTAPHWVRGQIRDNNGQTHTLDFKQGIDWNGWSTLEAPVPQNLALPAVLERAYVVETGAYYTRGTLLFDGIELLMPLDLPVISPEEAGGQATDPYYGTPEKVDRKWLVFGGSTDERLQQPLSARLQEGYEALYLTGNVSSETRSSAAGRIMGGTSGYSSSRVNDQLLIFLDNSNDGLRKTNYQQWPWLMNTLRGSVPDEIMVFLPKPVMGPQGFTDELEAELLEEQFLALTAQGKQVYIFYGGGTTGIELKDGVRYIGTGRNQEQGVALYRSDGQLYYNTINMLTGTPDAHTPAPSVPAPASGNIVFRVGQNHYTVNGEQVRLDTAPYIKNDRLMVPVAHISRALGIPRENVEWDGGSQTVLVRTAAGTTLLMNIGSTVLWADDQQIDMGAAAEITRDRSFVPISRFASAMGISYEWHPDTQTVIFQ